MVLLDAYSERKSVCLHTIICGGDYVSVGSTESHSPTDVTQLNTSEHFAGSQELSILYTLREVRRDQLLGRSPRLGLGETLFLSLTAVVKIYHLVPPAIGILNSFSRLS